MSASGELFSMYVCAPIELFPFTAGDVVIVNGTRGDLSERLNVLTNDRRFTLRIGEDPGVEFQVELGTDSCGPVRGEDGPPWLTVPVAAGSGFGQPLVPGKLTSFEQDGGRLDVYLGRSRSVLGCVDAPGKLNVEIAERWSL